MKKVISIAVLKICFDILCMGIICYEIHKVVENKTVQKHVVSLCQSCKDCTVR